MQIWTKEVFADNNIIDFSLHSFWAVPISYASTICIIVDEIILNFLMFYNEEAIEHMPGKIECNHIYVNYLTCFV